MARTPKSPQQKKHLSLTKDRRGTYGESNKGSRKTVPRKKKRLRQADRHAANAALKGSLRLPELDADVAQSTAALTNASGQRWKKAPDTPLGNVVALKRARRVRDVGVNKRRQAARLIEPQSS